MVVQRLILTLYIHSLVEIKISVLFCYILHCSPGSSTSVASVSLYNRWHYDVGLLCPITDGVGALQSKKIPKILKKLDRAQNPSKLFFETHH